MALPQKHFIMIAEILRDAVADENGETGKEAIRWVAARLAEYFKRENPEFNPKRFYDACGFSN
jgi:hypothetical protein